MPNVTLPPGTSGTKANAEAPRLVGPGAPRGMASLGAGLHVKGEISGNEDLHVDGKVEGPISLGGHRLTVGAGGKVTSDVVAREVIVYGTLEGDLRARDRIEIKKNGSVTGSLVTARIMIEDGAFFKGQIEIDRSGSQVGADLDALLARSGPDPL